MHSALILEDLKLRLNIGVSAAERNKKQIVILQIKIIFKKPSLACITGKITDTICYAILIKKIQQFCKNKKFTLIEELGMLLLLMLKKNIPKNCKLFVRVEKQQPLGELARSVFEVGS